jgi:shikimate kinase
MDNLHSRPLLAKGDPLLTLTNLSDERKRYYEQADVIIDTDNLSATQALRELVSALQERDVLRLENTVQKEL